jgi:hypothetical protein
MSAAAERPIFMQELVVGKERLRIEIKRWEGRWSFSAWRFWQNDAGDWKPTKRGVSFAVERLPDVADVIDEAVDLAKSEGII